jgi:hypothetical protein
MTQGLDKGFPLEAPDVSIRWGASVTDLVTAFTERGFSEPRRVTPGYYTAVCQALGGLKVQVGFHFEPQSDEGRLGELEIFDNGEREIERSYRLFHERLVQQFGVPTREDRGPLGESMPNCEWRSGSTTVMHYAMDRFGPEEHLRIRKGGAGWSNMRVLSSVLVSVGVLILYTWCFDGR